MYKLKIGSLPLPKIYIAEVTEAAECRRLGVPYIVRPEGWDDQKIIKAILWRTLVNKFPHIRWQDVLGFWPSEARDVKVKVLEAKDPEYVNDVQAVHRTSPGFDQSGMSGDAMDVSDGYRESGGGLDDETMQEVKKTWRSKSVDDYVGDLGWCVNAEELQALRLLPEFLDDIANAVKSNLANTNWWDGWNKKLEAPLGCYKGTSQAPNLIVLDVSGSVPRGISHTMVALIETLRSQANADLIITSWASEYWKSGDDLPTTGELNRYIGGCNECVQFYKILREHVLGKHWGNVIVFGDNDAPEAKRFEQFSNSWLSDSELQSTRIDRIMSFHTYKADTVPGYGLWADKAAPKAERVFNTNWTLCMDRY